MQTESELFIQRPGLGWFALIAALVYIQFRISLTCSQTLDEAKTVHFTYTNISFEEVNF